MSSILEAVFFALVQNGFYSLECGLFGIVETMEGVASVISLASVVKRLTGLLAEPSGSGRVP